MSTAHTPDTYAHGAGGHHDHSGHGHDAHGHEDHDTGIPHASMRDYVIGFLLSVVLTAIPFWMVMSGALPKAATGFIIMGFAVAQIVVHMVYFLHLNAKAEKGWTMVALIFTLILVVITLAGSLWVMHHLNVNMMPGHAGHNPDVSQLP
jgi:cytochrome o ubiquinol oxidase operon protein cyoD